MQETHSPVLEWLQVPPPWEAVSFPVSPLPRLDATRAEVCSLVQRITESAKNEWKLDSDFFLEMAPLELSPDGPNLVIEHGADWLPMMGLGVWPDQGPPTLWTVDELWNLPLGAKPRPIMDQLLRLTGPKRDTAPGLIGGFSVLLAVMTDAGGSEKMIQAWKALYLPRMQDPLFKAFPFYAPLLKKETIAGAGPGQLEQWLGGARFYLRECKEDQTILLLADRPLAPVLERSGVR